MTSTVSKVMYGVGMLYGFYLAVSYLYALTDPNMAAKLVPLHDALFVIGVTMFLVNAYWFSGE